MMINICNKEDVSFNKLSLINKTAKSDSKLKLSEHIYKLTRLESQLPDDASSSCGQPLSWFHWKCANISLCQNTKSWYLSLVLIPQDNGLRSFLSRLVPQSKVFGNKLCKFDCPLPPSSTKTSWSVFCVDASQNRFQIGDDNWVPSGIVCRHHPCFLWVMTRCQMTVARRKVGVVVDGHLSLLAPNRKNVARVVRCWRRDREECRKKD